MIGDHRVEINKVDNGYTIRLNNDNVVSKVFELLDEALEFIGEFMEGGG